MTQVKDMNIEEIEAELFALLTARRQKLLKLVLVAFRARIKDADVGRVNEAFQRIVSRQNVESFGDISDWHYSEMCLKE